MPQRKTIKVIRQNWLLGQERVLKSIRMWAKRRRMTTIERRKNWFQVRIWSIV
jgi:hypothetical protein